MIQALKWISTLGIAALVLGFVGLSIAIRLYPDNNLLGGWALVLGPVYWLGWLLSGLALLGWIAAGIVAALRRARSSGSPR